MASVVGTGSRRREEAACVYSATVCISATGMEAQVWVLVLPGVLAGLLPRHHQGIQMEAFGHLLYLFFY